MKYGIHDLMTEYGCNDAVEMVEEAMMDGNCPAICTKCGYTTEMEPDQDKGWCDECEKNTVKSAMVLMGVI